MERLEQTSGRRATAAAESETFRARGAESALEIEAARQAGVAQSEVEALRARQVNALDVRAAVGEGQALRMLGNTDGARQAFTGALFLEPNCVPAWLESAVLHLAQGELGPARDSLRHAEAAQARSRGAAFVSAYEHALAYANPVTMAQLRSATGEAR
jgi:Flp pilus assembly protein TadD